MRYKTLERYVRFIERGNMIIDIDVNSPIMNQVMTVRNTYYGDIELKFLFIDTDFYLYEEASEERVRLSDIYEFNLYLSLDSLKSIRDLLLTSKKPEYGPVLKDINNAIEDMETGSSTISPYSFQDYYKAFVTGLKLKDIL